MSAEVKNIGERMTYAELVWQQLKKNKLAMVGLVCIAAFIIIAVCAPLIAFDKPLVFNCGAGWEFPFWKGLFDRNAFESSIDIIFNTALVLAPIIIAMFALAKKGILRLWRALAILAVGIAVISILIAVFPMSLPYRNYVSDYEEAKSNGVEAFAIFPPLRCSYREIDPVGSHPEPMSRRHLFGTDSGGRDIFARMIYGTRIALSVGVVAVSIYIAIGTVLGSLAGFFGGRVDIVISRAIEIMLCFPVFFLILTIAGFIEDRSIFHIMLLIGLTRWTGPARLVRGEFLRNKQMDYVQAATALGLKKFRIIFGHVLPNSIAPVLVTATFGIAAAVLVESSLSFLGLGDPTVPSWGEILTIGRIERRLNMILIPGFAIFALVSVFNLLGEGLRDAIDPKLRR